MNLDKKESNPEQNLVEFLAPLLLTLFTTTDYSSSNTELIMKEGSQNL